MFTRWLFSPWPEAEASKEPFSAVPARVAIVVAWLVAVARLAIAVRRHEHGLDAALSVLAVVVLPAALLFRDLRGR